MWILLKNQRSFENQVNSDDLNLFQKDQKQTCKFYHNCYNNQAVCVYLVYLQTIPFKHTERKKQDCFGCGSQIQSITYLQLARVSRIILRNNTAVVITFCPISLLIFAANYQALKTNINKLGTRGKSWCWLCKWWKKLISNIRSSIISLREGRSISSYL